jgi:hypothetical protein
MLPRRQGLCKRLGGVFPTMLFAYRIRLSLSCWNTEVTSDSHVTYMRHNTSCDVNRQKSKQLPYWKTYNFMRILSYCDNSEESIKKCLDTNWELLCTQNTNMLTFGLT